MTSECEYLGDTTFAGIDVKGQMTKEAWLRRAGAEYAMSRFVLRILNMDDKELKDFADALGTTDDERGSAIADLLEWFSSWEDHYKEGAETLDSTTARLLVIGERLIGRQEWAKH